MAQVQEGRWETNQVPLWPVTRVEIVEHSPEVNEYQQNYENIYIKNSYCYSLSIYGLDSMVFHNNSLFTTLSLCYFRVHYTRQ